MGQFRQLGCSLDYARERFTMDDALRRLGDDRTSSALWEAGWIYRANRIVNWCPYHQTAISDLEVEHVELDDALTYARYPFADGSGSITIATVRPATILADVAVAVTPTTRATRDAVGKEVVVPVVGRHVPVIADARVEPDFGSGALKITPGHDPVDFEIGRDHGLETLTVIGPDGRMTAEGFEGLTQQEADERVVAWLKEHGQLEKRESYRHSVGTCERCHSRIEPLVSPQWWCQMDELAAARRSRRSQARQVRFHPESQHRFAIDSLEARARLVRLAPALVGPPDPDLDLPRRPPDVRLAAAGGVCRVRLGRARARDRRPRHLVLLGALAVRDARLARADARSSSATTRATSTSPRARSSGSGRTG